ncbi:MAG: PKD-like domain-containing protein [Bacteroidota bacterium]
MNIKTTQFMGRLSKTNQKNILASLFLAFVLLLPFVGTSQTACTSVSWSSGWCTICGGSSYACNPPWSGSGNWNNGIRNFGDPIPGGNNMTSVCVTVRKADCGYGTLCVSINGFTLQCLPPIGDCWCGNCWPQSYCFSGAVPGYNYGGTNSVQITISGGDSYQAVCVTDASICFNYAPSCIQSGAPSFASASPNPTCGGSTTLSVGGGSLGTGASWNWYANGCPGSFVGSGSSINVSPSSTTTYYVRAQGNCNTTSCASVTVSVNTPSSAPSFASASPNPLCGGGSTTLSVGGGSLGTGASWNWYSGGCGGSFVGSGSSISVSPSSTTTYFVRAQGTCNTTACASVTVTSGASSIAPSSATASPNPTCGGSTTLTQNGGSLGLGASYKWYLGACGGTFIGTGSSINVAPSSTTTYYVHASGTCNTTSCAQVTVTVNSAPVATASPSTQSICSGGTTSIGLTSSIGGTSFTWTVSQSGVSGATSGSGASIAQTLSTTGPVTGTAVYTVTPTAGGCVGNSINVTVVVNPIPTATALPSTQVICSGGVTSIALTSNVSVTSFNWTVVQTGAIGAATGSGSTIAQTIVATGTTPGTAVYTVIPSTVTCTGPPLSVTVTVNPKPVATAIPSTQTICSGDATSIPLTSNISGTVFNWTAVQTGVSGASAGSGATIGQTLVATGNTTGTVTYTITPSVGICSGVPILVTISVNPKPVVTATPSAQAFCTGNSTSITLSSSVPGTIFAWTVVQTGVTGGSAGAGSSIIQALSTTGSSMGTAVYTITPSVPGTGCIGNPINVTITINPYPLAIATPTSQTICSGSTTGISLTSNVTGTTFAWTISQNTVTGGSAGAGSSISQTLSTTGSTPGSAVYTITPTATGCVGFPISVIVNVDRTPIATATPAAQTICAGDATAIALTSDIPGSTFAWTVVQSGASGASAGAGSAITQILSATGITAGTVTYSIIPTSGNCPGLPISVTITVNPKPIVTATPPSQAICSGSNTAIALTSNIVGTTFSWTVNQTGVSGATAGAGSNIAQALTLTGSVPGSVVYTVTPSTSNGCLGTAITIVVTVNKADNPSFNYSVSTYCQTEPNPTPAITGLAGGTFTATPAGLVFININSGQINLSASTIGTYAITYLTNGPCPTPSTANVTIVTLPSSSFSYTPPPFCQYSPNIFPTFPVGASAGVFSATPSGLVFVNPATGEIDLTLSTPGTYMVKNTIVPGPCPGDIDSFPIIINTAPIVTATPSAQSICSGITTGIALTSTIGGTTYAWTVVQTGVSGASAGTGASIAHTLLTTGNITGTAVYTIIPTTPGGCPGQAITVTITVNPIMVATATPTAQTICSYGLTNIALTSTVVGTFFSWTIVQSGVSGGSSGSGSTIAQTINTTSTLPGTITYTITPSANSCSGAPIVVVITVNPVPVLTATPSTQTLCSGATTSIALTSNVAGTTFAWTFNQTNASGASDGTGPSIAQTLTALSTTPGIVTYTVVPTVGGCSGTPVIVTVTVNPRPVVTASPPVDAFCSFGSTSIALTSNVAGTTYAWTVVQSGVTGATPGTGSTIVQTLSTTGTVAGTAIYTITPTANGCAGTPINDTITVSPIPIVTATPVSQTFCSGGTTSIALASNVIGTIFSWTVVQTGVSGATVGSGSTIADVLSATGIVNGTAAYTITPSSGGGCQGSPISVSITVKPRPVVTPIPSAVTICSGDTTFIALVSNIPGTTFVWTVSQTGVSGGFASSGNTIKQSLTATGTTPGFAIYTVSPTFGTCPGTPVSDTVKVNPRPVVTATPSSQNICSGETTAIALSSNVIGTTFPWTVTQVDVSGATAGSGSTIAQTLTNTSFFALPGTATYTVTPLADGCAGTPVNIAVIVKRTDNAAYSYTSGTYCQSAPNPTPVITGLPGGTFSATPAGLSINPSTGTITNATSALNTYVLCYTTNGPCPKANCMNLTITVAPIALFSYAGSPYCQFGSNNPVPVFGVGASAGIFSASPAGLVFVHVNTGEIDLQLSAPGTYVVTNLIPAGGTCAAETATFTITINPGPTVTATPANQTICSGSATSFVLTSTMPGTTYSWTIIQTGVSGGSAGTGTSISQVLATTSTASGTAVYIITPTASGCVGLPITVTVTVNSIPFATAIPSAQIICSGDSPLIVLTSNIVGTTFGWTVVQTGVSGASIGSGSIISQALTATGTSAGTAVYTITPTSGGCLGAPISVTITVNPKAVAIATPSVQTICSGDSTSIALSSNIVGTTFTWTVAQSGASGGSASNGSSIVQVLSATFGTTPGTVTYTITPSTNGCEGAPILVTITVNPNPIVTISPGAQTVCSGTATSLALTSNISGTTFAWTVVQSGVSGATAGSGQNIVQTLTATGSVSGTAIYKITPTANGCQGIAKNVTVTVNPTPLAIATPTSQTICSGNITSIALSSNVSGTTFSWTVSQNNVTGATAGAGFNIAQTLSATTSGTALYIITPNAGGCPGAPISVTITVKPTLVAVALPATKTICSGSSVLVLLSSNIPGTVFSWTVNQNNTVGAANGSNDTIAQTLTATGTTPGTATYTVTPVAGGCSGLPIIVTITVNPPPVVTSTPSAQTLCSGATTSLALSSTVVGTTFSWTVVQTGVTGATAGSGSIITQSLTTTGLVTGTAVYTITPSANGCAGTPINVTVTVRLLDDADFTYPSATFCISGADPIPTITGLPGGTFLSTTPPFSLSVSPTTGIIDLSASALGVYTLSYTTNGLCPNTSSINITIGSTTPSASFSYLGSPFCQYGTNPTPIYGAGASAGFYTATPAGLVFAHVNTGEIDLMLSAPGTYLITNTIPVSGTCAGATANYSITIDGAPTATATPSAQTICSGSSTSIVLTSSMPGTTYAWTVVQSGVSGASAGANDSILQTLSTTALVSGSAVYTIIPTAGNCTGLPITVTIIIDPCPIATAIPSTQAICSGGTTSIALSSNIIGTAFAWTVVQTGATGAAAGSGGIIAQTLTATGTSAGTAVYSITLSANGCVGIPLTVTVTINPVPVITATPSSQTICTGDTSSIVLTSTVAGTTFTWTASQLGVSGGSDGGGDTIAQILSATGTVPGVITYTITPNAPGDCPGQPITVSITVNPDPIVTATPMAQIICSGGTTAVILHSNVSSTTFAWTVVQTKVTGATAGTGSNITQTLSATDSIPGTAVYSVIPTDTVTGCPGIPVEVTVTVNPLPVIKATPASQVICTGSTTGIVLSSNVFGTSFSWTVVQTGITGAVPGSGATIAQTLAVAGTTTGTAVYTITSIGGGCTGSTITVTITVNTMDSSSFSYASPSFCQTGIDPLAIVSGLPGGTFSSTTGLVLLDTLTGLIDLSASPLGLHTVKYTTSGLCSDTSITYVAITAAPGVGFTYQDSSYCQNGNNPLPIFDSLAIGGVFSATPAGLVFSDSLTGEINLSLSSVGTYAITNYLAPSGGCGADSSTINITIVPLVATATPLSQAICSGTAPSIALTSSLPNTTYIWTVVETGITGASAGSDSLIAQTLTLTGSVPGTAVYTITPSNGVCVGDTIMVTITVNPAAIGIATPTSETICSDSATSIVLTSNTPGTTFSWIVNQSGVSGAIAGTDSIISQTLSTTGTNAGTAIYTITPYSIGCSGSPINVTVTVNPSDDASFTYTSATYCQSGANPTPSITGLPGGTFTSIPSSGLTINPATGTIDLASSTIGVYILTYTTNGTVCPNSSSITMTISNTNPSANFSYPGTPYCQNGSNPLPVYGPGASAGIFSSSPSGLVFIHVNTGEIDLAASNPGTYTVTNTIPASGTCLAAVATSTVTISMSDDASFIYTSATYCRSGIDPIPSITGLSGGTFSATPAGLSINASTGIIDLDSCLLGVYTLTYSTNGTCPDSSSITMVITDTTPSTNISYSGSPFCQNGSDPFPVFGLGASAGIFSASPSGLTFVHLNTGQIDLLSSTPGTYTVTNTIPVSGSCLASSSTTTVIITAADDASFVYTSSTYCQSGTNPTPSITGLSGGTFTSTPVGLVLDSITGSINLSTSSLGTYTLFYTTNSACQNTSSITMTITDTTPSVSFSYPASPFCQNGYNPSPTFGPGASAGIFSSTPVGLTFVNLNTGEINLAISLPGVYTVTNTIPASGSCLAASTTSLVTITTSDDASFTYTSSTYCNSGSNPTPAIAGLAGGTFSSTPVGLSIDPSTGTINLATSALGVYNLCYSTNGTCPFTECITMTITDTTPTSNFSYTGSPFCQNDNNPFPAFATGASAGIFSAIPAGLVFAHVNTGEIDLGACASGTYTVINTIPASGTCLASISTSTVIISSSPTITATPSSQTICTGQSTAIVLTSSETSTTYNWTVNQTGVSGATVDSVATIAQTLIITGSNIGIATYNITSDANGCPGTPIIVPITINPLPLAGMFGMVITPANCYDTAGSILGLIVPPGQNPFTYTWTNTAGDTVANGSADLNNAIPGTYSLNLTDMYGCSVNLGPFTVTSTSTVISAFTANPTTGQTPLTVNFTNSSTNATNYLWQFGISDTSTQVDPTYVIVPTGQFQICLIAYNAFACTDTSCSTIDVDQNSVFVIPNIFTPNGDNVNDVFTVQGIGLKTLDAEIFNRWGQKEAEWHTTSGGWDGRTASGLEATTGTYYYIINATGKDGKEYSEKGSFSLIRDSK